MLPRCLPVATRSKTGEARQVAVTGCPARAGPVARGWSRTGRVQPDNYKARYSRSPPSHASIGDKHEDIQLGPTFSANRHSAMVFSLRYFAPTSNLPLSTPKQFVMVVISGKGGVFALPLPVFSPAWDEKPERLLSSAVTKVHGFPFWRRWPASSDRCLRRRGVYPSVSAYICRG